jgi:sugar fermentation stimulation protein A
VSAATGAARKLAWTLEQVRSGSVWVGVHTLRANRLAEEALCSGLVRLEGLGAEWTLRREVGLGQGTRLDLCLDDGGGRYLVEVKNITWVEEGTALFPDAVTARGARHLGVLETFALSGGRAAVLYVAQRGDAQRVTSAWQVDPTYAAAFSRACRAGVRACGVRVEVTAAELRPAAAIPVEG